MAIATLLSAPDPCRRTSRAHEHALPSAPARMASIGEPSSRRDATEPCATDRTVVSPSSIGPRKLSFHDAPPRINAATFAAASSCSAGNTWEYVSSVMAMLAWPNRSLTTFAGTLAASAAEA